MDMLIIVVSIETLRLTLAVIISVGVLPWGILLKFFKATTTAIIIIIIIIIIITFIQFLIVVLNSSLFFSFFSFYKVCHHLLDVCILIGDLDASILVNTWKVLKK